MRHILVKVHPHASSNQLLQHSESDWEVWLTAVARENKANKDLIVFLAKTLKMKKSQILILKGEKSPIKMIGIEA